MDRSWFVRVCRSLTLLVLIVLPQNVPLLFAADSEPPPAQPAAPATDNDSEHQGVAPNCRAEVKKLCAGIRPGGGRIKQCIEENEQKLSPTCQKAVQERLKQEGSKK